MMAYIHHSSRDNARTPMQWGNTKNAGFTTGSPWLPVNSNYQTINVSDAFSDRESIFYFYKKLIALRQQLPIITTGRYEVLDLEDEFVYAYRRIGKDSQLLVISNFSDQPQIRHYNFGTITSLLIGNYRDDAGDILRAYETKVYLIEM
jgi:oligo-1,6-glucosidase